MCTPAAYSVNPITIAVQGSGGNETSTLIFQVRDASGQPISGVRTVDFAIDGGPNGGEYIYPTFAPTAAEALATTHLNSGTISGPVRIVAQVQGTNISSGPVQIAIVSGPPDPAHFTVVTAKLNLYALGIAGVTDQITAFVGDKYGNPVLDGTSVWFTTACGIIQPGSGTTGEGITSNTLVSCAPWPDTGFFWVQGWTIDGYGDIIQDSTRILWSGNSYLLLSPTSFNIPNGGSENFTITVCDVNKNPLTEGTTISVSADAGELRGETSTLIPDTQSRAWTSFQFQLMDDKPDTIALRSCRLTVNLTSPNGNKNRTIYGSIY
ncbi:MAG: Ig-like domain-containing protein [Candidatus Stahlbacteria bacterium]|nr:Ig-like domain-containing protein [Candidatus Stahlbacteria bacterium]